VPRRDDGVQLREVEEVKHSEQSGGDK
jgi:hypothetical protein